MSTMTENKLNNVSGSTDEVMAWKRYVVFTYDGKEYEAKFYWSEWDGYELFFNEEPRWYSELVGEECSRFLEQLDEMSA